MNNIITYNERIVQAAKDYYKTVALYGHALDKNVCEARRHLFACLVDVDGIDNTKKGNV